MKFPEQKLILTEIQFVKMQRKLISLQNSPIPRSQSQIRNLKTPSNVPKIQIFIHNLDHQITNAYQKLRQNYSKDKKQTRIHTPTQEFHVSLKKQIINSPQTTKMKKVPSTKNVKEVFLLQESERIYKTPMISARKPSQFEQQNSPITLISNEEVIQYINFVYKKYSIPDPLNGVEAISSNVNSYRSHLKQNMSVEVNPKVKLSTFKKDFHKEISSVNTMKKRQDHEEMQSENQRFQEESTQLHHNLNKNSIQKDLETTKKMKKQFSMIRLLDEEYFPHQKYHHKHQFSETFKNPIRSKINLNSIGANSRKQNQNKIQPTTINTSSLSIPQYFRYCFMCQEQILQKNLSSHESKCEALKKCISSSSLEQILSILEGKINRFMVEIQQKLMEKQEKQLVQEIQDLKSSVNSWLVKIPMQNALTERKNHKNTINVNKDWRKYFNKIQQNYQKTFLQCLETINKLNWFSKLQENMMEHYG